MSRVNRILEHQSGDLTVTVEAGVRLRRPSTSCSRRIGQWLALDPPFAERATIGGLLATNDSGPQRHRFGTPRDLVIGIEIATMDGAIAKAGGQVVKNVAGYDLSKIMSGSFGSLGGDRRGDVQALAAARRVEQTVRDRIGSTSTRSARVVDAISASQLEPVAFEARRAAPPRSAATLRRSPVCSASRRSRAWSTRKRRTPRRASPASTVVPVVCGEPSASVWIAHARRSWEEPGIIVRASWLPANMPRAADRRSSTLSAERRSS